MKSESRNRAAVLLCAIFFSATFGLASDAPRSSGPFSR
jgi:hypothetical protein